MKKDSTKQSNLRHAFTLAEVLITLGIIGIVAAMTIPTLISNYKKRITEVRLQQTWSIMNNAINMAKAEHGDIDGWNCTGNETDYCLNTYILPYLKITDKKSYSGQDAMRYTIIDNVADIELINGTSLKASLYGTGKILDILVDINSNQPPNQLGIDKFHLFLVLGVINPQYSNGDGLILKNVKTTGLYYDGYGLDDDNYLKTNYYRGCSQEAILQNNKTFHAQGAYCIALIAKNNWKIPDDYPKKF